MEWKGRKERILDASRRKKGPTPDQPRRRRRRQQQQLKRQSSSSLSARCPRGLRQTDRRDRQAQSACLPIRRLDDEERPNPLNESAVGSVESVEARQQRPVVAKYKLKERGGARAPSKEKRV